MLISGDMYMRKNRSAEALEYYQKEITALSSDGGEESNLLLGILYKKIGLMYKSLENSTAAAEYIDLAVEHSVLDAEVRQFYSSSIYREYAAKKNLNGSISSNTTLPMDKLFGRQRWLARPIKIPIVHSIGRFGVNVKSAALVEMELKSSDLSSILEIPNLNNDVIADSVDSDTGDVSVEGFGNRHFIKEESTGDQYDSGYSDQKNGS